MKHQYCTKMSCIAVVVVSLVVLGLIIWQVGGSSACDEWCDAFTPACGVYNNEHQFFYSQCAMVRENCLTRANWKPDHLSHCNVNTVDTNLGDSELT